MIANEIYELIKKIKEYINNYNKNFDNINKRS